MRRRAGRFLSSLAIMFAFSIVASAKSNPDRTQFSRDIRIEPGEQAADVTCLNCNIYVRGQVAGDVTTCLGNVVVEQDAAVAGDVTVVLGDVRIEKGAKVSRDITVFGGVLRRHPDATISGDITGFGNEFLVILMITSPVVVLGLIIAFIVWLVQRSRRRASVAASSHNLR